MGRCDTHDALEGCDQRGIRIERRKTILTVFKAGGNDGTLSSRPSAILEEVGCLAHLSVRYVVWMSKFAMNMQTRRCRRRKVLEGS